MKFDFGSLTSTSEGWTTMLSIAGLIFGVPVPENVAADPTLMAWILMAEVIAIGLVAAVYINGRSRVKEAAANGKESA